ncbi:Uma2 family endonuclease [Gloeocapsopsis crepidinum LEGE 06123]|uniref:Uma2 family endonuclease n=1 Tax=Gloeocapsopsis crepidinum LEGE 06123 TaxID=588587 RepID=A0ABR9US24_9CHRO|nr:Uma2 family endonuclease [Gloeocapsopsis crepidinum]MBE9191092.1 Uma2 family endonuclease [Gloeocapsopsis crepidinum LEGE 06123]
METLAKWTVDDYHRMIASGILDDRRVELLAGEIHEMTPEAPIHTFCGGSLADYFRDRLNRQALVREARPITLTSSEPEPDIAIVRGSWSDYRERHPGANDIYLVVEISNSSLTKDLEQKQPIYAAAEIQEYWILDLTTLQLIVFRDPQGNKYQSRQDIKTGIVSPLAFPEITISIEQLFSV